MAGESNGGKSESLARGFRKPNAYCDFQLISRNRSDSASSDLRRRFRPFAGVCRSFYRNATRRGRQPETPSRQLTQNAPVDVVPCSHQADRCHRLWCFHPVRRNLFAFRKHHPCRVVARPSMARLGCGRDAATSGRRLTLERRSQSCLSSRRRGLMTSVLAGAEELSAPPSPDEWMPPPMSFGVIVGLLLVSASTLFVTIRKRLLPT